MAESVTAFSLNRSHDANARRNRSVFVPEKHGRASPLSIVVAHHSHQQRHTASSPGIPKKEPGNFSFSCNPTTGSDTLKVEDTTTEGRTVNDDTRYKSGSSLEQTKKEEAVTRLEDHLGEMTDDLFEGLKKLTTEQLAELLRLIRERETAPTTPNPKKTKKPEPRS